MIKEYIKLRRNILSFYLGVIIIFPLISLLNKASLKSVNYCILIITFLLALYIVIDYIKYATKIKHLQKINLHLTTDKHPLFEAENEIEAEYQKIITSLYEIIQDHVEMIEKAHSEQVEYYTMWVHQIKTPISAMQLALHSNLTEGQSDLLNQELFKIEQYVELALQYTKMTDLSTDLIIRGYCLEDIVHQSVKKYASLFIYKKLSIKIDEFNVKVTTDSKWLAFILEQLLSNAIKYTNQGGIEISYNNHVLKITDTGIGIRAEDLERIFEKGYTGYNGRLDKKASGLGLYLVKKVSESLAIKVVIASQVGKGTIAKIIFQEEESLLFLE